MENLKLKKELLNFLWSLTSPPIPISDKAKEEAGILHSRVKNIIMTDVANDESIIKSNGCALPSVDEAGVMAVKISEMVEPPLTEQEQAFFIAGFCECVKWLASNDRCTVK